MANRGPVGSATHEPIIDRGTNSRSQNRPPRSVGTDPGLLSAVPISPLEARWIRARDWVSEVDDALGMLAWWALGSPAMGDPHGGDLVYGPGDSATEHIKNTAAYEEAVQIYKEWLNAGQPPGKFENSLGTPSEYVSDKGYFYVKGRAAAGSDAGRRADATQVLKHPVWAYTGQFAVRFTDTGYPKEGNVTVEIENFTSLPSYFHGIGSEFSQGAVSRESLYEALRHPLVIPKTPSFCFLAYIPADPKPPKTADASVEFTYKVVPGDSLSSIAKALWGDVELWPLIYDKNRQTIGPNPDKISVGQSLLMPAKDKFPLEQINQARKPPGSAVPASYRHRRFARSLRCGGAFSKMPAASRRNSR